MSLTHGGACDPGSHRGPFPRFRPDGCVQARFRNSLDLVQSQGLGQACFNWHKVMPRPAKRQKADARNPLKKPWTAAEIRADLESVGLIELALFDKALRDDPAMLKETIKFANGYAGSLRQTARTVVKLLGNG